MGIEPPEKSPEKAAFSVEGGAKSSATADAGDLKQLAAAIRGLSPGDRARLAAMLLEEQANAEDR
jgi:hypothetical protein